MGSIDGKIIWITGASSGIGAALTLELNRKGCKLIISARDEKKLEEVRARCVMADSVKIIPLDLIEFVSMPEKAKKAIACFGGLDILINNAGISQRSLIQHTSLEVYKKLMDVNYLGTIALSKAVLPFFLKQKKGHFVTVSSLMGKFGSPYRSGYCAAKHALHGFFDVLRMEHEKDGIDVSLICPGFVNTEVAKNALTADGTPKEKNDDSTLHGMDPAVFAQKMIHAVEKKKFEVYIGKKEKFGVYLKRYFPRLLHKVILRSKVV